MKAFSSTSLFGVSFPFFPRVNNGSTIFAEAKERHLDVGGSRNYLLFQQDLPS